MLINIIRENIAMGKNIATRENIAMGSRHITTSDGFFIFFMILELYLMDSKLNSLQIIFSLNKLAYMTKNLWSVLVHPGKPKLLELSLHDICFLYVYYVINA